MNYYCTWITRCKKFSKYSPGIHGNLMAYTRCVPKVGVVVIYSLNVNWVHLKIHTNQHHQRSDPNSLNADHHSISITPSGWGRYWTWFSRKSESVGIFLPSDTLQLWALCAFSRSCQNILIFWMHSKSIVRQDHIVWLLFIFQPKITAW